VIVGGLVFGTVLTLYVIPAAYTLLVRKRHPPAEEFMTAPAPAAH